MNRRERRDRMTWRIITGNLLGCTRRTWVDINNTLVELLDICARNKPTEGHMHELPACVETALTEAFELMWSSE